jgi:glycosyltransferase involved in cell wall biosynthesis
LWEQVTLPRAASADALDAFFSPAYTTPLRLRVPRVVAIHDVSFFAHPEWFPARQRVRRQWLTRRSAETADAILTISEFSRGEIAARLGVEPSRIRVIPPGVTRAPTPPDERVGARLLYVGSIFQRRHLPTLVRAFGPIARRHHDAALEIVGDDRSHPAQDLDRLVTEEGLAGRVRWRRYVSDEELTALYETSRGFAFLSEYEGLGLTPLEALAAGLPPVLADTAVAHESCGAAALYVPLHDLAATTAALERVLYDEDTRSAILEQAPSVLARYDWGTSASATLAVIERAARLADRA